MTYEMFMCVLRKVTRRNRQERRLNAMMMNASVRCTNRIMDQVDRAIWN